MPQLSGSDSFTIRHLSVGAVASLVGALACAGAADPSPSNGSDGGGGTSAAGSSAVTGGTGGTAAGGMSQAGTGTAGTTSTGGSSGAGTAGTATTAGSNAGGASGNGGGGTGGNSGGAGGAGGVGGAAGTGGSGGVSGGGSGVSCATLKLCDDFEGDAPGKGSSPWKTQGAVEVATDVSHSGTHSVHIKATSAAAFNANINTNKPFPSTDAWGRAWVQIKATGTEHQMFIGINLSGDQGRLLNRLGSDTPQVNFQKGDKFYAAQVKFTQGTWFCYEWHVTDTATTIYIDGKKQSLTNGSNGDAPGIKGGTSLLLGFQRFVGSNTANADVWYDDVAVGDSQIGCQ